MLRIYYNSDLFLKNYLYFQKAKLDYINLLIIKIVYQNYKCVIQIHIDNYILNRVRITQFLQCLTTDYNHNNKMKYKSCSI